MKVSLEPITFVARFHADDDAVLGDPFLASCTVTCDVTKTASLSGFSMEHFGIAAWHAMNDALAGIGIKRAIYIRRRGNRSRLVEVMVNPSRK